MLFGGALGEKHHETELERDKLAAKRSEIDSMSWNSVLRSTPVIPARPHVDALPGWGTLSATDRLRSYRRVRPRAQGLSARATVTSITASVK